MNKSFRILSLLATGLAIVGCQDFENGFSSEDVKKAAYAKNFEKVFGTPDPNQDWSMATLVKANVNLPGITGTAKMNICTGDPRLSSTRLLAQIMLKDGKGSIDFDAIKGSENVFVTVEQDGEYKVFSQYAFKDGMLNIGEITPEMLLAAAPKTRAFSDGCSTKQEYDAGAQDFITREVTEINVQDIENTITYSGKVWKLSKWVEDILANPGSYVGADWQSTPFTTESVIAYVKVTGIDWTKTVINSDPNFVEYDEVNDKYILYYGGKDNNPGWNASKTLDEWKADATASWNISNVPTGTYKGIWTPASLIDAAITEPCTSSDYGAIRTVNKNWQEWVVDEDPNKQITVSPAIIHPTLQYLDNVDKEAAPAWTADLGYSFFGPGSFFEEGVKYYSVGDNSSDHTWSQKLGKYYTEEEMLQMEEGFSITTKGGPIELPYIFGCTAFTNQFGYVYWKVEDESKPGFDPLKLKHFVLIEDARPSQNVYKEEYGGTKIGNQELQVWDGKLSGQYLDGTEQAQQQYQELANKSYVGTTYRVMYFGDDYKNITGSYDWDEGYRIMFFIVSLSNSELPERIESRTGFIQQYFNYSIPAYNNRLSHEYQQAGKYPDRKDFGLVKTIAWSRDGKTFLGFGDDSGDQDLNDIVFLVAGNFDTDIPPVKVAPIKWHLNYNGIHHDADSDDPVFKKDDDLYFQESKNVGGTYSKPSGAPVRTGYVFKGWAATPDGPVLTDAYLTDVTVADESGACYFAIWEPVGETVKIRWHLNYDGTHIEKHNGEDGHDVYATNTVAKSTGTYNKPSTNPTRSGYTFLGWATEPNATEPNAFTGDHPADATAGESDICYYALWELTPDPGHDPEPITWILACEDLGGSFDYDFNDVVWSVKTSWNNGTPTTKVKVLAAGGTLGFALKYNGNQICTKGTAFTEATTDDQVVNAAWSKGVTRTPKEFTLDVAIANVSSNWTKFSVVVKDHGDSVHEVQNVQSSTTNSKAPQIILLPEAWEWPTELTPIDKAYTNFSTWVTDNKAATWDSWAANKQNGKTVSRN